MMVSMVINMDRLKLFITNPEIKQKSQHEFRRPKSESKVYLGLLNRLIIWFNKTIGKSRLAGVLPATEFSQRKVVIMPQELLFSVSSSL